VTVSEGDHTPLAVVVVGARGRLGRLVLDEVQARVGVVLVGAVNRSGPSSDADAVVAVGADLVDVLYRCPMKPRVVIDVATAGATAAHAEACAQAGTAYLCASTGISDDDVTALDAAAATVPVIWAPNLSPGAHLVALLAKQAATILGGADVEIVEVHHRKKKDAPSGTALMLADAVRGGRAGAQRLVLSREGEALRQAGDIGVVAVRGGDVVGEHSVCFFGDGERVELSHKVSDRGIFAKGALDAAEFLGAAIEPGRYQMTDVLASRLLR
jgi:4-hydroxy-tetrahydrodipicolinate reductase